jgi:hypothetical protein
MGTFSFATAFAELWKLSRNFLANEPENHPPSMVLGGAAPPDYKIAGIHILFRPFIIQKVLTSSRNI